MRILYPYKNALWALRPAKPLGVLSRHPCRNPKPLPRGEGLCMLCWLCIVQSLCAYTPGIRAGLNVGLPPSSCLGLRPKPHFYKLCGFIDSLKPPRLKGGFPFIRFSSQALYTSSISCSRDRSKISCPAFCQARSPTFHSQSPS